MTLSERAVFDRIRRRRGDIVPVVGAGLAAASGAPTAEHLVTALSNAAGTEQEASDLFAVADQLEGQYGTEWVQDVVANAVSACRIVPSPALLALTLVPGRLVATTNYDLAVEHAAARHGLVPVSLTTANFPAVLRDSDDREFRVLHLHGIAADPRSLILTARSYEAAFADEALQLAVRTLAVARTLAFLGHSLATRETHLRRDISLVMQLFGPGEHLLLRSDEEAAALEAATLLSETGVETASFANADGSYRFVVRVAQVMGAPPLIPSRSPVVTSTIPVEAAYCPMAAAPAAEVSDDAKRAVWLYGRFFGRRISYASDLDEPRLLLFGDPGAGKTQTLLRLAQDSNEDALFLPLDRVTPPQPGEASDAVFVSWMRDAVAFRDGVPQVTTATLGDASYAFFLDGFDEVTPERRPGVIAALNDLAERWPHHRWAVSSRRVPELEDGALRGFADYELVPSREWLADFAAQRGLTAEQLEAHVAGASGLDELLYIPMYAAAAVDAVINQRPPPASALALLLDFASHGLRQEETRARADLADIEGWLDRLSLAMLVADVNSVEVADAGCAPLRGAVDHDVTVNWLVTRVLLRDHSGHVRPLIRPLRDARAARALAQHPRADDVFRDFAIATVAGERHLRGQWQYLTDLLLGSDLSRWGPLVEPIDPLSAARAVPVTAPAADRHAAIGAIWAWYRDHRLHIPRTREGQLVDDFEALVSLAHDGLPHPVRTELVAALGSSDMALRANAVAILARVEQGKHVRAKLGAIIGDAAAVVRRRAAEAIAHLGLKQHAAALLGRALQDPDELARRTLASVALQVAPDSQFESLVVQLPESLQAEVQLTIDRRWDRRRQLQFLASSPEPSLDRLDHLVRWSDEPWNEQDVELLAEAWCRSDPLRVDERLRNALLSNPEAAIRGCFRVPVEPSDLFSIAFLLDALPDDTVDDLSLNAPASATALVERYREWRATPPPRATERPSHAAPTPPPSLDALIDMSNLDGVLAAPPTDAEVEALPPRRRAKLRNMVSAAWSSQDASTPITRILKTGERQWRVAPRDWALIDVASTLKMPLAEDDWYRLADLGTAGHDEWLDGTFEPGWAGELGDRIDALTEDGLEAVARAAPLSADVAEKMADRCLASQNHELRRVFADAVVAQGHQAVLQARSTRLPSLELDTALVRAGDPAAEARLLNGFVDRGCPSLAHFGSDRTWIDLVRQPPSGTKVLEALRLMLRRGDEPHNLTALFNALHRCTGEAALAAYDSLMTDPAIPDAAFLWYQRQEAIVQLTARPATDIPVLAATLFAS